MQYFLPIHYSAFRDPLPKSDSKSSRLEKQFVRDILLELDNMLWPFIDGQEWDLHRHRQPIHYVSSDHFIYLPDGKPIVDYIDCMWLHYGKSPKQLDFIKTIGGFDYRRYDVDEYFNAFYMHTRIQFFVNENILDVGFY